MDIRILSDETAHIERHSAWKGDVLAQVDALQAALATLRSAIVEAQAEGLLDSRPDFVDLGTDICLDSWAGEEGIDAAKAARLFGNLKTVL